MQHLIPGLLKIVVFSMKELMKCVLSTEKFKITMHNVHVSWLLNHLSMGLTGVATAGFPLRAKWDTSF